MVDEIAIPDRLEQAIGEPEGENVLRRLLAEEVVNAEDLILAEDLVQVGVELFRALQVDPERLLHDDARAVDEASLGQRPDRRQCGLRRHAEIMQALRLRSKLRLRRLDRRMQRARTGFERHVLDVLGKPAPVLRAGLPRREGVERVLDEVAELVGVHPVERQRDDPAVRDKTRRDEVEQPRP